MPRRDADDYTANRALGDALGAPAHASPATHRLQSAARQEVRQALERAHGSVTIAAAELGVTRAALHRWLARWPDLRPKSAK